VEQLRKRLVERAASTEAVLPSSPDSRKTMRDALRGLLSRLLITEQEHAELVRDLMDADYGANDALAYLQLLKAPRVGVITAGLQPSVTARPIPLALLVLKLDQSLTSDERGSRDYQSFRGGLDIAVRTAIAGKISRGLKDGLDDDARKEITGLAGGALRGQFVPTAVAELRKKPEAGEARDTVSEVLMSALKQAHPNKYENLTLKGLNREDFLKSLDELNTRLRNDGYAVP
jgi:hypothetical protein